MLAFSANNSLFLFAGYLPEPKATIEEINRMLAAQSFEEQARAEQAAAAAQPAQHVDMDVDMDTEEKPREEEVRVPASLPSAL